MSSRYEDIIHLPHHVSSSHRPMPMESRAAQFAPFAALSGHEDAIADTAVRKALSIEHAPEDELYPDMSGDVQD